MAKVIISIMSANNTLSERNCSAIINTYVSLLNELRNKGELCNEYDVVIYSGGFNEYRLVEIGEHLYKMECVAKDGIYRTFEKTIEMYNGVIDRFNPNYFVRTNISTYINIRLLDAIINDVRGVVANAVNGLVFTRDRVNEIYPRGDFYIADRDIIDNVLKFSWKYAITKEKEEHIDMVCVPEEHADDALFGLCMRDAHGESYVDKLTTVEYGFFPGDITECAVNEIRRDILSFRVKGVEPGSYSGKTWEDTKYRKKDYDKILKIHSIVKNFSYTQNEIKLKDLILDDKKSKPIICLEYYQVSLAYMKQLIKNIPRKP